MGAEGPTMELPSAYLEQTLEQLRPLCASEGAVPVKQVQSALGKAARIGYIVPDASPFISSLWAAYSAGRRQAEAEAPGTSKHRLPIRRFAVAAQWALHAYRGIPQCRRAGVITIKEEHGANRDKLAAPDLPVISFDASPWGGGGILWSHGVAQAYTHFCYGATTA